MFFKLYIHLDLNYELIVTYKFIVYKLVIKNYAKCKI